MNRELIPEFPQRVSIFKNSVVFVFFFSFSCSLVLAMCYSFCGEEINYSQPSTTKRHSKPVLKSWKWFLIFCEHKDLLIEPCWDLVVYTVIVCRCVKYVFQLVLFVAHPKVSEIFQDRTASGKCLCKNHALVFSKQKNHPNQRPPWNASGNGIHLLSGVPLRWKWWSWDYSVDQMKFGRFFGWPWNLEIEKKMTKTYRLHRYFLLGVRSQFYIPNIFLV